MKAMGKVRIIGHFDILSEMPARAHAHPIWLPSCSEFEHLEQPVEVASPRIVHTLSEVQNL
jgi:hypothetical protein